MATERRICVERFVGLQPVQEDDPRLLEFINSLGDGEFHQVTICPDGVCVWYWVPTSAATRPGALP